MRVQVLARWREGWARVGVRAAQAVSGEAGSAGSGVDGAGVGEMETMPEEALAEGVGGRVEGHDVGAAGDAEEWALAVREQATAEWGEPEEWEEEEARRWEDEWASGGQEPFGDG